MSVIDHTLRDVTDSRATVCNRAKGPALLYLQESGCSRRQLQHPGALRVGGVRL